MTFALMRQLLTDPVVAINRAKHQRNYNELLALVFIEWVLVGLGLAVTLRDFGVPAALSFGVAIGACGIVLTLFGGFLLQLVFHVLGGKGTYWTGLTVSAYSKFPLAFAILLGSILFTIPFIGTVVGVVLFIVMAILSFSTLYRSIKELFQVDIVTAWIGVSVLLLSFVVTVYLSIILLSPHFPALLSFLRPNMMSGMMRIY